MSDKRQKNQLELRMAHLQGQGVLIVRGHPRIQPDAKHFRRLSVVKRLTRL